MKLAARLVFRLAGGATIFAQDGRDTWYLRPSDPNDSRPGRSLHIDFVGRSFALVLGTVWIRSGSVRTAVRRDLSGIGRDQWPAAIADRSI